MFAVHPKGALHGWVLWRSESGVDGEDAPTVFDEAEYSLGHIDAQGLLRAQAALG